MPAHGPRRQQSVFKPDHPLGVDWGHPIAKGLRLCLHFFEGGGEGAFDLVTGRRWTFEGGTKPAWGVGSPGRMVNFNGTNGSEVRSPVAALYQPSGAMSVHAVCKPETGDLSSFHGIYSGDNLSFDRGLLQTASGKFEWRHGAAGTTAVSATSPSAGTWYNVLAVTETVATGGCKIYLNGLSDGSGDAVAISYAANPQAVGTFYNLSTRAWNGDIATVRLWDRGLTPDEARWLYEEPYVFLLPYRERPYVPAPSIVPALAASEVIRRGQIRRGYTFSSSSVASEAAAHRMFLVY